MRPLAHLERATAAAVHTFITDIDDTVTTEGALTAEAYSALERLKRSGLRVIVTTGRPAGWCDHFARMWPVDAVVGENGACAYWFNHGTRRLLSLQSLDAAALKSNQARVAMVAERVLATVPGAALASDQFCRLYDLAIDYCEDVPRLPEAAVQRIVSLMEAEGMTAKVSSIHVNGWFGQYDKLSMSRSILRQLFDLDLDAERERVIYAGDSPNDAPMFAHFPNAVGVANVQDFVESMAALPQYVTHGRSGKGFTELTDLLIAARIGA